MPPTVRYDFLTVTLYSVTINALRTEKSWPIFNYRPLGSVVSPYNPW